MDVEQGKIMLFILTIWKRVNKQIPNCLCIELRGWISSFLELQSHFSFQFRKASVPNWLESVVKIPALLISCSYKCQRTLKTWMFKDFITIIFRNKMNLENSLLRNSKPLQLNAFAGGSRWKHLFLSESLTAISDCKK